MLIRFYVLAHQLAPQCLPGSERFCCFGRRRVRGWEDGIEGALAGLGGEGGDGSVLTGVKVGGL